MPQLRLLLPIVAAVALIAACAHAADEKLVTFTDQEHGFHIGHPADWKQGTSRSPVVAAVFVHAQRGFGDNLNVVVTQLPKEMTEDELDQLIQQALPQHMTDFHVIADTPVEVAGHHAHRFVYTATMGNRKLEFTQVAVVRGKTNYTITFTTLPERQNGLDPVIDRVLKSFDLDEKGK